MDAFQKCPDVAVKRIQLFMELLEDKDYMEANSGIKHYIPSKYSQNLIHAM